MKNFFKSIFSIFLIGSLFLSGCGNSKNISTESVSQSVCEDTKIQEYGTNDSSPENPIEDNSTEDNSTVLPENDLSHRKLIRTVDITLETKSFDTLKTELEKAVDSFGGYAEYTTLNTPSYHNASRHYSLTLRIPSENLDTFLEKAGTLGTITHHTESQEDITLDYVDLTTYQSSLDIEYEKVTQLLEQATDLDQILLLESKLSDLRYERDRLESRIRTYDNLIEYSTVHMEIEEVAFEKPVKDSLGTRISTTFRSSMETVKVFSLNLVVGIIGNLPILLLIGLFVFIFFLLYKLVAKKIIHRRLKKAQKKATSVENPTEPPKSVQKK